MHSRHPCWFGLIALIMLTAGCSGGHGVSYQPQATVPDTTSVLSGNGRVATCKNNVNRFKQGILLGSMTVRRFRVRLGPVCESILSMRPLIIGRPMLRSGPSLVLGTPAVGPNQAPQASHQSQQP
jgi:hypothetical protein